MDLRSPMEARVVGDDGINGVENAGGGEGCEWRWAEVDLILPVEERVVGGDGGRGCGTHNKGQGECALELEARI